MKTKAGGLLSRMSASSKASLLTSAAQLDGKKQRCITRLVFRRQTASLRIENCSEFLMQVPLTVIAAQMNSRIDHEYFDVPTSSI
jgi:hypothetical protein